MLKQWHVRNHLDMKKPGDAHGASEKRDATLTVRKHRRDQTLVPYKRGSANAAVQWS